MRSHDRRRSGASRGEGSLWAGALLLSLIALLAATAAPPRSSAQDDPAGVFDEETRPEKNPEGKKDEEKKPAEKKPEATKKDEAKAEKANAPAKKAESATKKGEAPAKGETVTDRDSIGFNQENVSSQMAELEERMFRLSEALRSLEPENASRLRLALNFSREELILQQMKETQTLLKGAQLREAETEVRELLAKLEHLRGLLLAEDLDFQMKLARLRQMREALAQLDRIIKEERRELAWSRSAVEAQKELEGLRARRTDLDALIRDQAAVIGETKESAAKGDAGAQKAARAGAAGREAGIRKAAAGLAADPAFATLEPPYLKQSDAPLGDAVTQLEAADTEGAIASEENALKLFREERDRLDKTIARAEGSIAPPEFGRFERDQAKNREATDTLGKVSARLGNTGVSLQKGLIRAGGSMQDAEGDLSKSEAKPAADDQLEALKHLAKSREDLAKAAESLLVELRAELQARIIAELTEMHEIQASIREATEAQAPRVAKKSRTATVLVAALAPKEAGLAERTGQLLALVEETEFGIALPTSLRVLSREMKVVEGWLKESDASPRTIALERRIEDDLLALVEAMRRLPPTTPPPPGSPLPSELRARERELNRLVAELKMIRLLQSRLNDDTTQVDGTRPAAPSLPPDLRGAIETLKKSQDEIRDSLARISERLEPPAEATAPPAPRGFD